MCTLDSAQSCFYTQLNCALFITKATPSNLLLFSSSQGFLYTPPPTTVSKKNIILQKSEKLEIGSQVGRALQSPRDRGRWVCIRVKRGVTGLDVACMGPYLPNLHDNYNCRARRVSSGNRSLCSICYVLGP